MKLNLTEDAERPDKLYTAKSVRPLHLAKCDSQFDGVKFSSVASTENFKSGCWNDAVRVSTFGGTEGLMARSMCDAVWPIAASFASQFAAG